MAEAMSAHPHEKHRERVRNLFLHSGLDGFSDHNILEMLLFYTIPKGDTNLTAHNLIDAFGSLDGVLDASVEELCKVKGVGQYTAVFLTMLPQLARRYYNGKTTRDFCFTDREEMREYVTTRFIGQTNECAFLLAFDASGHLAQCIRLAEGNATHVQLEKRQIMEAALRVNAVYVALAHNHPGGVAAPSAEDIQTTKEIAALLSTVGIRLVDHLIVAGTDCFSMVQHTRFQPIFI